MESTPGKELPPEDPEEGKLLVEHLVKLPVEPPIEKGHPRRATRRKTI